ncbi:MAG: RNA-binding cell elongation regulator Jag/EloR [Chloroflexota bacterium]
MNENERTTLEIIAPTVEEALAQGLAQLGLPADAVSVEVLDTGSKGLFGLGGRQVRVRLTVNPPPGATPPLVEQKPQKVAAPAREKPASKPAPKSAPATSSPQAKEKETTPAETPAAPAESHTEGGDALIETTEAMVSKLLHHLGFQAQVSAHYEEDSSDERRSIHVDVRGDDLSALIGRHAETLNAFQYVASLMVGKEAQQWVQLVVDVEGYRGRREKQLRQLARRMAEQVTKTGRRATLEPMTSSERRVIHLELRGHPAVTTESTGEEPYRKVMILPKDS